MNILITGASGYLGAKLASYFSGFHNVYVASISSLLNVRVDNLENTFSRSLNWGSSIEISKSTEGMDVIIHAAGLNADGCQKSIIEAYEINVIKTAKILDSAIKNNVKQFIYLSTAHVYGELHGKIIESATPEPIHPYGLSKFAGEEVVKYFSRKDGKINYQILRLANVFGPPKGDNQTCWNLLVNDLCLQAIKNAKLRLNTNGLHSRNFLTMQDFLESIAHFLKNQDMSGVYNVGTEKSTTIMEMAELISERYYLLFGKKIYIEKNEDDKSEKNHILYDCSKLVSTGFQFTNKFSNEIDDILKMLTILRGMKI